jgi:hypothetical protein
MIIRINKPIQKFFIIKMLRVSGPLIQKLLRLVKGYKKTNHIICTWEKSVTSKC